MAQAAKTTFTIRRDTATRPLGLWPPTRVEVNGALDLASVVSFRTLFGDLVGDRKVIVDLSGCDFVDSAGIGALVGASRRIRDAGGEVTTVGASPAVAAGLRMAGVVQAIDLCGTAVREPAAA